VEPVVVGGDPPALLDLDNEITGLVVRLHLGRRPNVALAVRRVLEHLAVFVAIPLGRLDVRRALEPQHPLLVTAGKDAIGGADGDDEVVARPVLDWTEDGLKRPAPFVDVEHLVHLAVAVEVLHR
jgi:hypothetical protein